MSGRSFGRLPEAVEEEVERAHYDRETERHEYVYLQAAAECDTHLPMLAAAVERADNRCDAGGKAYLHHCRYDEKRVDESRGRKFVGAVGSHHHGVGEVYHYDAYLSDEYGEAQTPQVGIFGLIGFPESGFACDYRCFHELRVQWSVVLKYP